MQTTKDLSLDRHHVSAASSRKLLQSKCEYQQSDRCFGDKYVIRIPLLPGQVYDQVITHLHPLFLTQIGRSHFHKSHAFDYRGDVPVCVEEGQSGE